MIENLNSKLYEKYEIRRQTNDKEGLDIAEQELKRFAEMLNEIKEDRPTSHCKVWISFESEIQK